MRTRIISYALLLILPNLAIAQPAVIVNDPIQTLQNKLDLVQQQIRNTGQRFNNLKMVQQGATLAKSYLEMKRAVAKLKRTADALTGKYGYGRYLSGPSRLLDPAYHPSSTEELVRLMASGYNPGKLGDRERAYDKKYPRKTKEEVFPYAPDSPEAHQFKDLQDFTKSLTTNSEVLYGSILNRKKVILALQQEIDKTENIKAAMDLNNRLAVEIALNSIEQLHLQTLQARTAAARNQGEVNRIIVNQPLSK